MQDTLLEMNGRQGQSGAPVSLRLLITNFVIRNTKMEEKHRKLAFIEEILIQIVTI